LGLLFWLKNLSLGKVINTSLFFLAINV